MAHYQQRAALDLQCVQWRNKWHGVCMRTEEAGQGGTHAVHSALQFLLSRCLTAGGRWLELRYRVFFPFELSASPPQPQSVQGTEGRSAPGRAFPWPRGLQQPQGKHFINITTGRRQVSGELTGSKVWRERWSTCHHMSTYLGCLYSQLVCLDNNSILRQVEKHYYYFF